MSGDPRQRPIFLGATMWVARVLETSRQRFRRVGLWPRLVLAATAGFLVLFGGFTLLSLWAVRASTDRILEERGVIAKMAANDVDRLLERAFYELVRATDFAAFDPAAPNLSEEFHMLAHTYGRVGTFAVGVYFLNAEGRVVLSHPQGRWAPGTDLSGAEHIHRVLAARQRSVSEPFLDPFTDKPAVALTIPILRGDGSLQALVGGLIDMSSEEVVGPLGLARDLGKTGHAELVDGRGVSIASTEPGYVLHPGEHVAFYIRMLREGRQGTETVPYSTSLEPPVDEDTVHHVMAFVPLAAAPWGVAVGGSDWETFAPVRRLRSTLLLAGSLALLVLWGATLMVARALVRPVRTLTIAAARIASEDLEVPIHATAGGEIGVLAESLETMRVQLRESLRRVRQWGQELEVRVQERTEELALSNRQLAAVTAVVTVANEARDLSSMLDRCLEVTLEQTGMEAGAIRLWDPATRTLVVAAHRGVYAQFPCWSQAVGPAECPCGHAAQAGTPVFLSAGERAAWRSTCRAPVDHTITALPLRSTMETLGVLYLSRSRGAPLSLAERETLQAIASELAVVTRNVRLREELGRIQAQHELDRMKAELISVVSHELRTPLGIIRGYATTLLREDIAVDDPTRREFLQVINEESDKLGRMIADLLDASRLQAGRLSMDRRGAALQEVLGGALAALGPQTQAQGHPLRVSISAEEMYVQADPARLEQVLRNLVDNAVRYSDAGGPVDVIVQKGAHEAVVSVRDWGDGVPPEEVERIFEPFFRGANARRRGAGGAGLGLAICRGIVEAHGGRLWVESAPGAGSTFTFSLPLVSPVDGGSP